MSHEDEEVEKIQQSGMIELRIQWVHASLFTFNWLTHSSITTVILTVRWLRGYIFHLHLKKRINQFCLHCNFCVLKVLTINARLHLIGSDFNSRAVLFRKRGDL